MLSVETVGPRKITVGKQSTYEVIMQNAGETAADDVVVFVGLPAWADVLAAETTNGTAQSTTPANAAEPLQWKIGRLEAKSQDRLTLKIMPRQSRPFDLAVRWDYKPVASQAMIEVQEAKVTAVLEGPREVLFGTKEIYKLRLANTGTGDAENVTISLVPVGAGESTLVSQNLGTIAAGQQKAMEIELVARQAGNLTIQVEVRGDGGVRAELSEKVLVRRAALQMEAAGPAVQFVGAAAVYRIAVHNTGTAPANNVKLTVQLPAGAKYVSGIDGVQPDANGSRLQWNVGRLDPSAEKFYELKCSLGLAGLGRLEVLSVADDDLTASAVAATQVEAMADLVLHTQKPTGPTPIGQEALYEIRVRNQGSKDATDVEITAYFARGIEPTSAEGGQYRIAPGQVVFEPIASIAAGGEVLLKVKAKAEAAGNHVFRAEVRSKPLGTKLASEETAFYYSTGLVPGPGPAVPGDASPRTADRLPLHATQPHGQEQAPSPVPVPGPMR